jgi:UDP-perosamine 4-acetyltransferase
MARVVIVGNGGHARACVDAWPVEQIGDVVGYVGPESADVLGLPYLGTDDELPRLAGSDADEAFVALGSNRVRRLVADRCTAAGLGLATAVAATAHVGRSATVGAGSIVMHRAVLGANVVVGRGSIVNNGATVDHDCVIGDFVHIAPGVNLAGTITVGDGTFVGIGASVVPGIRIGAGVTVGAGAVVIRDIPDGQTVVGVPAQELKR